MADGLRVGNGSGTVVRHLHQSLGQVDFDAVRRLRLARSQRHRAAEQVERAALLARRAQGSRQPSDRLDAIRHVAQGALEIAACLLLHAQAEPRFGHTSNHGVPRAGPGRARLEMLRVLACAAKLAAVQALLEATPARDLEQRCPGNRLGERLLLLTLVERKARDLEQTKRCKRAIGLGLCSPAVRDAGAIAIPKLGEQARTERAGLDGWRALGQHTERGFRPAAHASVNFGHAPRDLGVSRSALERA